MLRVLHVFKGTQNLIQYLLLSLLFCSFCFSNAVAQGTGQSTDELIDEFITSIQEVLKIKTFVDANLQFCTTYARPTLLALEPAIDDWHFVNSMGNFSNTFNGLNQHFEGLLVKLEQEYYLENFGKLEARARNQATTWCQQFPTLLQSEALDLKRSFTDNLHKINDYHRWSVTGKRSTSISLDRQGLAKVETPSYQQLIATGKNPNETVRPTEFHCYIDRSGSDYFVPDFFIQLKADGTYQSTYGTGRYTDDGYNLTWTGVFTEFYRSYHRTRFYGQEITFANLELNGREYDADCYQQGAREKAALLDFQLKDPQQGQYRCRDTQGQTPAGMPAIELLDGRRYKVGSTVGQYQVQFRNSYFSEITFSSGSLEGAEATYEAERDGYRELEFSNVKSYFPAMTTSSKLSMICINIAEPLVYPLYGDAVAPPPPTGSGGLSGLYAQFEDNFERTSRSSSYSGSNYGFYYFLPEGYVYVGEPTSVLGASELSAGDLSKLPCQRTKPSGEAYCASYKVSGDTITIERAFSEPKSLKLANLKAVQTNTSLQNRRYEASSFSTSGTCLVSAKCSSSFRNNSIELTASGQFLEDSSSQSSTLNSNINTVMPNDFVPPDVMAFSNSENGGTYSIQGNVIELRFNNGRVSRRFIAILSPTEFQMDGLTYSVNKE